MRSVTAAAGVDGRELEVSAELFSIPLGEGRHIVYAPLRRVAFVANASAVNFISDLASGSGDATSAAETDYAHFLEDLGLVNGEAEDQPVTTFSGDPVPTAVTLFLTTQCNLRCTYCYASAGDTPVRSMDLETAKRGIRQVVGNALQTGWHAIEVNYHGGGEPTVNWDTLRGSFEFARELADRHGLELTASLATNGVMSARRREWIIAHLDGLSISFDGVPEAHDRHRVTVDGGGSSHLVAETLRAFDEADFPYGLRMTVTADQIEHLPASVAYVYDNFMPQALQVEPAYQLGRWRDEPSAETAGFIAAFRDARLEARARGGDITFSGARLGLLTNHFCGVTQDSFSLSPDGNVSACYEVFTEDDTLADRFFYGRPSHSNGGYEFDLETLDALRAQTVETRDYCKGCFAKWSCGGDCLNKAMNVNGEGEFTGTDRCHIIRELTKDQILDAIAASGGMVWKGEDGT